MRNTLGLVLLGLCALFAAAEQPGPLEPPVRNESSEAVRTPETVTQGWPKAARSEALALIDKYGEPDDFDESSLVWRRNGPWLETIVYREPRPSLTRAGGDKDIVEQSIPYGVPTGKIAALERFDDRLDVDPATGELSARSQSEDLNYLALNLADDIVKNRRSPLQARDFYRRTLKFAASGKTSPYLEGFMFHVQPGSGSPL